MKKLTVAIVYYKKINIDYFNKSVYSALAQIYNDYEIVIYSEDPKFESNINLEVKIVPSTFRTSPAMVREYIVNETNTDFLAFWDSDDIFLPNRLFNQMNLLENENLDLCFSNFGFFNEKKFFKDDFFSLIGYYNREINLLDENFIGLGITIFKTIFLKKLLPFPNIKTLDWWIAIKSEELKVSKNCCKDILGYYRIYENSTSNLINGISDSSIQNEIDNKIKLYLEFNHLGSQLINRLQYFKKINESTNFEEIKKKYIVSKYKNIWGGIVKYENK